MPIDSSTADDGTDFDGGHGQLLDLSGERGDLGRLMAEAWRARDVIRVLARKDFFVRYRRASFGVLWALVLPLLQAVVLAVVLSHIVRFNTPHHYVVFVFSGTVAFSFFSGAISAATPSIVEQRALSTRVYFPRVVFPLASVLANLYALFPAVAVLALLAVATGNHRPELLLLVPATVLATVLAAAFSLPLAGLQVYFRDIRYLVQAALVGWLYLTPVIYPLKAVGRLRTLVVINPATGVVEAFRAATTGADPSWLPSLWWTLGWSAGLFAVGLIVHRRFDRVFVDLL